MSNDLYRGESYLIRKGIDPYVAKVLVTIWGEHIPYDETEKGYDEETGTFSLKDTFIDKKGFLIRRQGFDTNYSEEYPFKSHKFTVSSMDEDGNLSFAILLNDEDLRPTAYYITIPKDNIEASTYRVYKSEEAKELIEKVLKSGDASYQDHKKALTELLANDKMFEEAGIKPDIDEPYKGVHDEMGPLEARLETLYCLVYNPREIRTQASAFTKKAEESEKTM